MSTVKELNENFELESSPECTFEDLLESINMIIESIEKEEEEFDNIL